jgi:para-aminobenzoate synthetase component 1
MIVDIVRNDISRVAKERSIKVDRYLELRKLPTVFHLVSTVGGVLKDNLDWLNTIEATFPMGSMTGAPKIRAMERIDSQESGRRGWYSGALGYVAPNGECDFNVIIRSLMYESKTDKWISWAGSALTLDADPKKEWEEINLKMDAPKHVLNFNK